MKNQLLNPGKALLMSVILIGSSLSLISTSVAASELSSTVEISQHEKKKAKHHKRQLRKMAKVLQLNDEQKEQIKSILRNGKAEHKLNREAMAAFKQEIKVLSEADVLDEAAVLSSYNSHSAVFENKVLTKIKTKHAILQVLTSEQRVKWQKHKAKRKALKPLG